MEEFINHYADMIADRLSRRINIQPMERPPDYRTITKLSEDIGASKSTIREAARGMQKKGIGGVARLGKLIVIDYNKLVIYMEEGYDNRGLHESN